MSREKGLQLHARFQVERNRFAIVLSWLRNQLPSAEYRSLLRMQRSCDNFLRVSKLSQPSGAAWVDQLSQELDRMLLGLEAGSFSREQLRRIEHLYRDLFLLA